MAVPALKIAPPKLEPMLPTRPAGALAAGISLEASSYDHPDWSSQTAHRGTFDTLMINQVDLTSTKLRETGWQDCRLLAGQASGADFTAASLRRLELLDLRASGMVMAEAECRDLVFRRTKLNLANFRFAKLTRVLFDGCVLADADFAGGQLQQVSFIECDLAGADFSGARLSSVDLRRSELVGIKGVAGLKGARLTTSQLMSLAPVLAAELGLEVDDS